VLGRHRPACLAIEQDLSIGGVLEAGKHFSDRADCHKPSAEQRKKILLKIVQGFGPGPRTKVTFLGDIFQTRLGALAWIIPWFENCADAARIHCPIVP